MAEVTASRNVILTQRQGNEFVQLNYATTAGQVKTADGGTVEAKLAALNSAVAGQTGVKVVADIAARDALTDMKIGDQCWVKDATGDSTVTKGAAKYLYESPETGWVKTGEAESLDLVINWGDIVGKPTSTPDAIDGAVSKAHEHTNKTDLDKLSVVNGQVAVDGTVMKCVQYAATLPDEMPADLVDGGLLIVG